MSINHQTELDIVLPRAIGNPAKRALAAAGIHTMADLTKHTEKELLQLHGVGPKAIRIIGEELADRGLSYARDTSTA